MNAQAVFVSYTRSQTAAALRALAAKVSERIDPGIAHTLNDEEVAWLQAHLPALTQ